MTIWEALILGLIQGLTEFLPVSSSGHLELGNYLLNTDNKENLLFTIIVHGATSLSTIVVFRKDIWHLILEVLKFKWNAATKFVLCIFISMIPAVYVGLAHEDAIEALFGGNILLVGSMLLVTGTLLTVTYFYKKNDGEVTFGKAIIIGLAQAMAILPGISRSGATIATGLLLGIKKETATRFSFLMVLIPILGATFLKVLDYLKQPQAAQEISGTALAVGFIAAFVSGLLACSWMIAIVKRGKLFYFAIYCFIVGLIAILAVAFS